MPADTTSPCRVDLPTGAAIGLSFHAQAGFVSLVALMILIIIIVRNYIRNRRRPPLGEWRLFRGNVDILMLNLIVADVLMSFGAIFDIHWVHKRQVYCGRYCNAQGVVQTTGETAAALSTLAVAVYTFLAVKMGRPPTYRPWLYLGVIVVIWLWCLLWPIILLVKYNEVGPGGDTDAAYAFTPGPWWCWINQKYDAERVVAEYLWLWVAGVGSIVLYVPAYLIIRNQQNQLDAVEHDIRINSDQQSIANTIDTGNEAVKLLWYPAAYTLCVLPLSIMRWGNFKDPVEILPATITSSVIFNLMGLINVLLIFWTRPAILLIGTDGTVPRTEPRYTSSKDTIPIALNHLPSQRPIGRRQDSKLASWSTPGNNGFGGANVNLAREEL